MFAGTSPQLFAVISGTINAISDGMQYGWTSPLIPILQREDSPVKITESDIHWLESIYMLGGICGLPITIYLVDKIGRKKTLLLAAFMSLIGWILIGVANHVAYLHVARLITGIAADVAFVSCPMYIAEIAEQKVRGFLSSLIYLMLLLGIVLIYSIAPYSPYCTTPIIGGALLIVQLILFSMQPESPYYLLSVGKTEEAHKSLRKLRVGKDELVEKELQEIAVAVARQKSERGRPQDLILVQSNRKALIIMTVINGAQHFSGISVILMNTHSILSAAGSIYVDSNIAAILFSCFMLVSATIASFVVDKYGRKILIILSCLFSGLALLTLAIYFALKYNNVNVLAVSWIPIVSIMVYAVAFKFGLGMVPIVLTAELFPAKLKALGMTISDAMYVIFAFISILLYTNLSSMYGLHVPIFIFAASTVATACFTFLYVPETKGKTLDEIQFILKGEPYVQNGNLLITENSKFLAVESPESEKLTEKSENNEL